MLNSQFNLKTAYAPIATKIPTMTLMILICRLSAERWDTIKTRSSRACTIARRT